MTNKTKKILIYVAAGLIIVGAAIGIIVDVNGGVEPEVEAVETEIVTDTVQTVADSVVVDTVIAE